MKMMGGACGVSVNIVVSAGSGGDVDDCFVDTFVQAHHNAR